MYEPKTQKGLYANIAVWVLGALVLAIAVTAVIFTVRWLTAPVKGKLQAREQINSGSNRIAQYDYFYDLCASVQAKEGTVQVLREELATKPSPTRVEQIHAFIAANKAARIESIRQYNVDARKSYTRGQFRASDLPYQLDPTLGVTTCIN